MMDRLLRAKLLAEGTSDRALLPIIKLTLAAHVGPTVLVDEPELVDKARLRPKHGQGGWVRSSAEEYPCELLFVHRDADAAGRPKRLDEIDGLIREAALPRTVGVTVIPIVPVRTTETWLLIDEAAIRIAASNPRGTAPLGLPPIGRLERSADPKSLLSAALRTASGLPPGRLRRFREYEARGRVAVTDLSGLRRLSAFAAFENEVANACTARGWTS